MSRKCSTGFISVVALSMTLIFATSTVVLAENQEQKEKDHREQKERPRKDDAAQQKKPRDERKAFRPGPARTKGDLRERGEGRSAPRRGDGTGVVNEPARPFPPSGDKGRPGGGWNYDRGNGPARGTQQGNPAANRPAYRKNWEKSDQDRARQPISAPSAAPAARSREPFRGRPVFTLPPNVNRSPGGTAVLPRAQADHVLRQVNSARGNLRGINGRPVPPGRVSTRRDGGLMVQASQGRNYHLRPDGTLASFSARGRTAEFRHDGKIRTLEAGNLRISRGAHNERRIVTVRPDRAVLVSTGSRRGYFERRVAYNDATFVRRTYVVDQTTYTRVYAPRYYNGVEIQVFMPGAYYPPAYYGWAVDPWGRPIRYSWGWVRDPWYGYYGSYYHPAAVYPSASSWLTDYVLADTLRTAYYDEGGEQPADPDPYDNDVDYPISPAVKGMLVREVSRQLAEEREAAYGGYRAPGIPWALREPDRMFVVSTPLEVSADNGEACGLAAGDVLRVSDPIDGSGTAYLRVMSRRSGDCAAYSTVSVGLNDLQEMNNSMRVRLYAGLGALRGQQDYPATPAVPPDAMSAPQPTVAAALPPSNENVLAMLRTQETEADQAEQQVMDTAFGDAPAASPPPADDGDAPAASPPPADDGDAPAVSPPPADDGDAPADDGYDYYKVQ